MKSYSTNVISCLLVGYPLLSSQGKEYWELHSLIIELTGKDDLYGKEFDNNRLEAQKIFLEKRPEFNSLHPEKVTTQLQAVNFVGTLYEKYNEAIELN